MTIVSITGIIILLVSALIFFISLIVWIFKPERRDDALTVLLISMVFVQVGNMIYAVSMV